MSGTDERLRAESGKTDLWTFACEIRKSQLYFSPMEVTLAKDPELVLDIAMA
jgi:hypothetical protein